MVAERSDTSGSDLTVADGTAVAPASPRPETAPVPVADGAGATGDTEVVDGDRRERRDGRERRAPADSLPRRGRRVRRVIRRIDLWSVLKLATVLYTCLYVAVLGTLALLWGVLYSSGQIERLQSFLADVGLENYRFYGDQMFRACAAIGAVGVLAATIVTVLTAALVNVISEMTGGIRVVVIEEDPPPPARSRP